MTFLNRHRSRIRPPGPFSPSSLFFSGIPGAWYDPTDLSTMFQDSAGTTPVTAVEQPVGLVLDKSQGLAQGSQLVVNGDGTTLTGWTAVDDPGCSSTVSGGQFVLSTVAGGAARLRQAVPVTAGKTYAISVYVDSVSVGAAAFNVWGTNFGVGPLTSPPSPTFTGTFTAIVQATSANLYVQLSAFSAASGITNRFDDVSVRELAGNHASQSTAASRPTYRARYNLLTYSEQFNDAYWFKAGGTISANTTLAPDGTTTADTWTATAGAARHELLSGVGAGPTTIANANHTFTLYVKKGTHNFVSLLVTANNTTWYVATFDFSGATPVVSKTGAGAGGVLVSTSIEPAANGFWRLGVTGRTTDAVSVCCPVLASSATPTYGIYGEENWTAAGTETAIFWGAQLLTAADVTATGNAYQRIAAATVYDTAPIFRPYLAFDGLDDSLATAAINFTATDKMTVFAGQTKLRGATTAVLAGTGIGNGSFELFAPRAVNDSQAYGFAQRTTAVTEAIYGVGFPSPDVAVLTGTSNIGAPLVTLRRNGTTIASSAAAIPAGNYGTFAMVLGQRSGGGLIYNGRLYSLIVRGAASSVTEIAETELWVNARTGGF